MKNGRAASDRFVSVHGNERVHGVRRECQFKGTAFVLKPRRDVIMELFLGDGANRRKTSRDVFVGSHVGGLRFWHPSSWLRL